MIYEPREDSFLLKKWVSLLAHGDVLDVGTGSGIQAFAASEKADSVLAVDIQQDAIDSLKEKVEGTNITLKKSDLLKGLFAKFDVIVFNPPYLPQDEGIDDVTLYGGKEGFETTFRFLEQAKSHLKDDGFVLFLISSFTNKKKVDTKLESLGYTWSVLEELKMDFESLYAYKAWLK